MKHVLITLSVAALLAGCESQNKPERFTAQTEDPHAGHHHGHDHGHDHGHHHGHDHGEHLPLGVATTAGITYEAIQLGELEGTEQAVEIVVANDSPRPRAMRIWIGNESAEGSVKAQAEGTGPMYEVHVETPGEVPADAHLWIEMENQDGNTETASFELKR